MTFRTASLIACLAPFWLAGPAEARCFIRGEFRLSSEGPWPFHMKVDPGTRCANRNFRSFGTTLFKRLNLVELPAHGKVELSEGGHYGYTPAGGYRGKDRFVLQICGENGGALRCTQLAYDVSVE